MSLRPCWVAGGSKNASLSACRWLTRCLFAAVRKRHFCAAKCSVLWWSGSKCIRDHCFWVEDQGWMRTCTLNSGGLQKARVKSHQNCGNLLVYLPGGSFPISSAWHCFNFWDVIHICERADFPSSSPEAILSRRGILMFSSKAGFLAINVPPLIRSPGGSQLWSHN